MGIDIATFLTTYSLVLSGNALSINPSYSIGDESAEAQNILDNLGGLLGKFSKSYSMFVILNKTRKANGS